MQETRLASFGLHVRYTLLMAPNLPLKLRRWCPICPLHHADGTQASSTAYITLNFQDLFIFMILSFLKRKNPVNTYPVNGVLY
ncbi:hypothetical protein D3C73_623580 [compost metagenome]